MVVVDAAVLAPLDKDVQVVELAFVVEFLERVELLVVCLSVGVNFDRVGRPKLALEGPFAVDEAHVAQVEVRLLADGAAELGELLLQLEDAVASVDDEEVGLGLARFVLAVAEPVEAVVDLTVPRRLHLPVDFFDVPEQVEAEIDAN